MRFSDPKALPIGHWLFHQSYRAILRVFEEKKPVDRSDLFFEAYNLFIETKTTEKGARTIAKYKTLRQHLRGFEEAYKRTLTFEAIESKYQFISTHSARRTFVTLSLEKGMRPETVLEITGHKEYKTLKKYIKITSKVKEIEMNQVRRKEPADWL